MTNIKVLEAYQQGFCDGLENGKEQFSPKAGTWEVDRLDLTPNMFTVAFRCSICNLHFDHKTNFCPNCGANMKGGAE